MQPSYIMLTASQVRQREEDTMSTKMMLRFREDKIQRRNMNMIEMVAITDFPVIKHPGFHIYGTCKFVL